MELSYVHDFNFNFILYQSWNITSLMRKKGLHDLFILPIQTMFDDPINVYVYILSEQGCYLVPLGRLLTPLEKLLTPFDAATWTFILLTLIFFGGAIQILLEPA